MTIREKLANKTAKIEGIKDTLLDLHNYAAMALMLLEENKE